MAKVTISHPELGPAKTRLADAVSASNTSATVDNNDNFATDDYVVLGKPGQEKSEIVLLTGTTNNDQIDFTGGCIFAHDNRDPVTEIKYNQVKIYRADSEDGSYSSVDTVDLDIDEGQTVYDDTAGDSSSWYKIKYYNSTTTELSDYSSAVQATGYTEASLKSMTEEVMEEFGAEDEEEITSEEVRRKLRAGVRKLTRDLITVWPDYRLNQTTQDLTSGTALYDLPTRFLAFNKIDVNFEGTDHDDAYTADQESEAESIPGTSYYETDPKFYFRGNQFGLKPEPTASGRAWLYYWDYPEKMTDDADEHGLPYGAREVLVLYSLWRLWLNKDRQVAQDYQTSFVAEREDYLTFIAQSRQSHTSPQVKVVFGHDLYSDYNR